MENYLQHNEGFCQGDTVLPSHAMYVHLIPYLLLQSPLKKELICALNKC